MERDPQTPDDHLSARRASEILRSRGWTRAYTVNEVVNKWTYFVTEVERGYPMTIDDYTNDLSVRRWAEEARELLPSAVADSMDQQLGPVDRRFAVATIEARTRLPGSGTDHWWERRLPRLLIGELAEDVHRMELL